MDTNDIIEWPGYGMGALKSDCVEKTFHSGDGNLWAKSKDGRIFNVHPLVIKAGGYNNIPEHNYVPGVYPIRWEEIENGNQ